MIITAVCCRFPQTYIISLYSPIDWLSYPFNVFFLSSVTTIRKNLMIRQLRSYIPILVSKYNLFNIFILFLYSDIHSHHFIQRESVRAQRIILTPPVPLQESERSNEFGGINFAVFSTVVEVFRQCGIFLFFPPFYCNIVSCMYIIECRKVISDFSSLKSDSPPKFGGLYTPSVDSDIDFRNRFTLKSVTSEHIDVGLQRVNDVIINPP